MKCNNSVVALQYKKGTNVYIAKVIGKVVSIIKHEHYENKTLLIIHPLNMENQLASKPTIAIDYVGAGEGDIVLVGAGPGTADEVFGLKNAPIRELIMGIVDRFDVYYRTDK